MGGKFRWQIIHIKEKNKRDSPANIDMSGSQENLTAEDTGIVNHPNRTHTYMVKK